MRFLGGDEEKLLVKGKKEHRIGGGTLCTVALLKWTRGKLPQNGLTGRELLSLAASEKS